MESKIYIFTPEILNLNTYFSTTQYSFSILYLPTQIQMEILYRKPGFKREFERFLMYKCNQSYDLFRKTKQKILI